MAEPDSGCLEQIMRMLTGAMAMVVVTAILVFMI